MRKVIFWIVFPLLIAAAYIAAIKYHEREIADVGEQGGNAPFDDDPSYSPVHTEPDGGTRAPQNVAELTVISVFADWSQRHFVQMYRTFTNAGAQDAFVARMQYTPISYYGISFISSQETADGWNVEFQVEVTSLASALAAAYVNVKIPYQTGMPPFRFTPRTLKIEEFEWVKQKWHLTKNGKNLLIDLGVDKNGAYRTNNILHYVLEAAAMPVVDADGKPFTGANQILRLVPWQMGLEISFGKSPAENERQIEQSKVLHDKAVLNLKALFERYKAKKAKGNAP